MKRKPIPRAQRVAIFERDGWQCRYCGQLLAYNYPNPLWYPRAHIDHINPVSRGGDNSPSNLQLTCADCNMSKATNSRPIRRIPTEAPDIVFRGPKVRRRSLIGARV